MVDLVECQYHFYRKREMERDRYIIDRYNLSLYIEREREVIQIVGTSLHPPPGSV